MGANKSYVGVDNVYAALITQDDASAYAADTPFYLAPVMTVSQTPKVNSKTQYADNSPFDVMSSEGETELDVEITGIELDDLATILGKTFDADTGRMFDAGGTAPYVALGFRAKKSDGQFRYYWYLKGQFAPPPEEVATQTDSPDPKSVKIKFVAITTTYEFDLDGVVTDGVKRVVGDTNDANFDGDDWFDTVQVPVVGAPDALTCTPSPVDGASSVAVTANITLTFNNAIAGGAEKGIILVRDATFAAVACARTLNAARTVVTLNPTASMEASEDYLVIVAGVSDIYGQSLADVVYDFETAA